MIYIKLNNIQAKKIAGKEDDFNANDPRFIEEDFFIVILRDLLPIAKRYVMRLVKSDNAKVIDMSKVADRDVIKLKAVFKETESQGDARMVTRVTKWDYTKITISKEL